MRFSPRAPQLLSPEGQTPSWLRDEGDWFSPLLGLRGSGSAGKATQRVALYEDVGTPRNGNSKREMGFAVPARGANICSLGVKISGGEEEQVLTAGWRLGPLRGSPTTSVP